MEKEKNTLKQNCKDTGTLISVLFYAYSIYLIVIVLYGIWALFQPESLFRFTHSGLVGIVLQSGPHYKLVFPFTSASKAALDHGKAAYLIFYLCKIVGKVFMLLVLYNLHHVFKSIHISGTPFMPQSGKNIRNIGFLVIAYSWIPVILYTNIFGITGFFKQTPVNIISCWPWLLIGIIFVSVSRIFIYGCALQQESDDTL